MGGGGGLIEVTCNFGWTRSGSGLTFVTGAIGGGGGLITMIVPRGFMGGGGGGLIWFHGSMLPVCVCCCSG